MLSDLMFRLRSVFRRGAMERELEEELRTHLEHATRKSVAAGLPPAEAARRAQMALGGIEQVKEACRDARGTRWVDAFRQDSAYAFRHLRHRPATTILAIAVLGATIGMNTTVFTVFTGIAARPWAVEDATAVVQLFRAPLRSAGGPASAGGFSLSEIRYIAGHSHALHGVVAMQDIENPRLTHDDRPISGSYVSGNYFDELGIHMTAGRRFTRDDDRVEAPRAVAVLGHHLWQEQFAADPGVIGTVIRLDGVAFDVIGVTPPAFGGTNAIRTDVWIPFAAMPLLRPFDSDARAILTDPGFCCVRAAGRLASGVSRDRAQAELDVLDRQFTIEHRQEPTRIVSAGTAFLSNPGAKRALILPAFAVLFAAVGAVLLLACANVGGLLLAQAAARRREVAVRMALGASRGRLLRQFLTENLLLAAAAGLLGLAISYVLPSFVLTDVLGQAVTFQLRPDLGVFVYTFLVAMVASLACGLVPALQGTRVEADEVLREHTGGSGLRLRARNVLLAVQVTLTVILLVSTALLVRGLHKARTLDLGFDANSLSALSIQVPPNTYVGTRLHGLVSELTQQLDQAGLGRSVALTSLAPLSPNRSQAACHSSISADTLMMSLRVSPAYLEVLRVPFAAGRTFAPEDGEEPVIVNAALARRQWPGLMAVGQTLTCGGRTRQVVGVVRDSYSWGPAGIEPTVYAPLDSRQLPELLVRTSDAQAMSTVDAIVKRLDGRITLQRTPLSSRLADALGSAKALAGLAAVLGTYTLILATVGMFGVFAYVVQQRTSELGIRMALGAQPAQVTWPVMKNSAQSVAGGMVAGVICAVGTSHLLTRYLYGVSPLDPLSYAAVILAVVCASMAASYLPARRTTRLDPIAALRSQ